MLRISFSATEIQPLAKPAEAQVEEEKGARQFGLVPTAVTEEWSTRPWQFSPRAELTIFFRKPVAEEKSNLCYMFGMTNDEELVEKALMASSSAAITSQNSINSNLITVMVDSRASDRYFDDAIIRDLKHRLQDYVHLATLRTILIAGKAILGSTAEDALQSLVADDYGNRIFVRIDIVVVPGIEHNLFSVTTVAKKGVLDYENPRLEGINVTVPLRSEGGDLLYAFVLDLVRTDMAPKR